MVKLTYKLQKIWAKKLFSGGRTMLILIAIILICSAMSDFAAASDWEASERAAERRQPKEVIQRSCAEGLSKTDMETFWLKKSS